MEQIFEKGLFDELHTIGDFIRWGASQFNKAQLFFGHGTDNAIDEAAILVFHSLHLHGDIPNIFWNMRLSLSEKKDVFDLFNKRVQQRVPAAYLTHEAWFADLPFYVDQHVLIPRSPIAELIKKQFQPWINADRVKRILDLCTGSGCIAIATALLALPDTEIDAVDVLPEILEITQKNINRHGLEQSVHTVHSNLFANLAGIHYDLIISNPPYVDKQELQAMPDEYQHEPKLGLEAGEDGLFFVKKILREASQYLTPNGVLIVEVGLSQDNLVKEYPELPFLWLEFEYGGDGVFLLTMEQLQKYANVL